MIANRVDVTHDTSLYTLRLPAASRMRVPIGQHVYVDHVVEGTYSTSAP